LTYFYPKFILRNSFSIPQSKCLKFNHFCLNLVSISIRVTGDRLRYHEKEGQLKGGPKGIQEREMETRKAIYLIIYLGFEISLMTGSWEAVTGPNLPLRGQRNTSQTPFPLPWGLFLVFL
jgi:hypothetical protein